MPRRFFELYDDVQFPHRWHLATPIQGHGHKVDDWLFKSGARVSTAGPMEVPIEVAGQPLDFSQAGVNIPVVHARVASLLSERAPNDVQLIPVHIEGRPDAFFILVATRLIRCIDEKASKVQFWRPEDGLPELVGQYYAVDHLRIDKSRVGDAQVFRPEGWEVALIVSGEIKDALERMGATGAKFKEV